MDEDEEQRLRATALKNARSIFIARQRAERELLEAKEALERKNEELNEQREWFEVTLSSIGDAVITTDTGGRVTFLNPVAQAMTGWSMPEAKGLPLEQVFHIINEQTRRRVANPIEKVLKTGLIVGLANHTALIGKEGTVFSIEDSAAPIRNSKGDICGAVMVFHDVTARRQAEDAARIGAEQLTAALTLSNRLVAVIEHSDDAIISKTLEGVITTWNPGAERMFGYAAEEIVGQSITVLIPPEHIDEEPTILERLKRGERIDHYQTRRRTKDGTLIDISLSVSPVKDASGNIVGASKIARDITEQKRAQAELRASYEASQREVASRERAEAALRENDRRKDEFLATLAHELRNPLAPIRQAALIAKTPTATDAQKRWSHDVISRQVQQMALLLDDLLDISRVTRGQLGLRIEMTELAAVIDAAVETARPVMDAKRHVFSLEVPTDPVHFAADPLRLAQVLSNLLTNAGKYTEAEGQIRLRATCDSHTVTISVMDTGIGIPREALASVFLMFSQVKAGQDHSEGGLGIGLALAKGLVELHGGTIEVKSEGAGRGSEFIVRLPRRELSAVHRKNTANPGAVKSRPQRVLLADDNKDAAQSLCVLLQNEGHEVTVVHNGEDALAALRAAQPEVAILDIGMPKLTGYDVARKVRETQTGQAMLLIALSGWGQEDDRARAKAAGFDHHFTKPGDPNRILELLRSNSIRGGPPRRPRRPPA